MNVGPQFADVPLVPSAQAWQMQALPRFGFGTWARTSSENWTVLHQHG